MGRLSAMKVQLELDQNRQMSMMRLVQKYVGREATNVKLLR